MKKFCLFRVERDNFCSNNYNTYFIPQRHYDHESTTPHKSYLTPVLDLLLTRLNNRDVTFQLEFTDYHLRYCRLIINDLITIIKHRTNTCIINP